MWAILSTLLTAAADFCSICATTRDAINNLPEKYRQILEEGDTCPVHFADVWVGVSYMI